MNQPTTSAGNSVEAAGKKNDSLVDLLAQLPREDAVMHGTVLLRRLGVTLAAVEQGIENALVAHAYFRPYVLAQGHALLEKLDAALKKTSPPLYRLGAPTVTLDPLVSGMDDRLDRIAVQYDLSESLRATDGSTRISLSFRSTTAFLASSQERGHQTHHRIQLVIEDERGDEALQLFEFCVFGTGVLVDNTNLDVGAKQVIVDSLGARIQRLTDREITWVLEEIAAQELDRITTQA